MGLVLLSLAIDFVVLAGGYLAIRSWMRRSASPSAQAANLREEVERIILELNQTTERNVAILEDKIQDLRELLVKADKKIGLLQREAEKQSIGAKVFTRIADARAGAEPPTKAEDKEQIQRQVITLHRAGLSPALIASKVGAAVGEVELIISLVDRGSGR